MLFYTRIHILNPTKDPVNGYKECSAEDIEQILSHADYKKSDRPPPNRRIYVDSHTGRCVVNIKHTNNHTLQTVHADKGEHNCHFDDQHAGHDHAHLRQHRASTQAPQELLINGAGCS